MIKMVYSTECFPMFVFIFVQESGWIMNELSRLSDMSDMSVIVGEDDMVSNARSEPNRLLWCRDALLGSSSDNRTSIAQGVQTINFNKAAKQSWICN